MALRDKLAERARPHLEAGEQVRQVFLAQAGPNPYLSFLTYLIFFWVQYRVVVVTDRAVVLLRSSIWTPASPKGVDARLPLPAGGFGQVSGLWGKLDLGGTTYYVHKRFHKDVEAADAALASGAPHQQLHPPQGA